MTTVPTSSDEAKKLGEDLIKKKGGPVLAKLTGMHMCTPLPVNEHIEAQANTCTTCCEQCHDSTCAGCHL